MNMKRTAVWTAVAVLGMLLAFSLLMPAENHYDRNARIGASDDLSGLVLDFMQRSGDYSIAHYIEPYFIRDC